MTAKEQGLLGMVDEMLSAYDSVPCTWGRIHDHAEITAARQDLAVIASDTGERGVILPESLVALARRCLHIAFVWNDHNFPAAHKMAREEATRWGIGSMDDANSWLDAPEEWPVSDALRAQPAGGGVCCEWQQQDRGGDWVSTECGSEFVLNDASQYKEGEEVFPHCPYCAKPATFHHWEATK